MAYLSTGSLYNRLMKREYREAKAQLSDILSETECIRRAKGGDRMSRDLLFYKNLGMLVTMAGSSHFRGYRGEADDLVSSAYLALDGAITDYDLGSGNRFSTYYGARAFNAMNKVMMVDSDVRLPENQVKGGVTSEYISMSAPVGDGVQFGDHFASNDDVFGEAVVAERESIVERMLGSLDESDRVLLTSLYLESRVDRHGHEASRSLREVGERLGLSHEAVRKRRDYLLGMLRDSNPGYAGIV